MTPAAAPARARPADGELATGARLDHYRVLGRLGSGAFATVYTAVDERDGEPVVLKVPDEARLADPRVARSWRSEVDTVARVDHPNVQRSRDRGERRSRPYLVLEHVDGRPLRHLIDQGPLSAVAATAYARQMAVALDHLEARGVLHRDIKPENLLVTDDGRLVLIDFGLATRLGRRRSRRLVVDAAGTPGYMAPEQCAGRRGDERSDLYAAGAVLYEMLAGEVPLGGAGLEETMRAVLDVTPEPLGDRNPAVPRGLDLIARKALRKDPEERYQYAAAFAADLDRFDQLDPALFTFGPERGGGALITSEWRLVAAHFVVAGAFIAVAALVVGLVVLLGR